MKEIIIQIYLLIVLWDLGIPERMAIMTTNNVYTVKIVNLNNHELFQIVDALKASDGIAYYDNTDATKVKAVVFLHDESIAAWIDAKTFSLNKIEMSRTNKGKVRISPMSVGGNISLDAAGYPTAELVDEYNHSVMWSKQINGWINI